ncbi:MAG: GntR family transcriptional regulator [Lachnospiraceae bacterium]|nr:GntR family transcriptional regulator [Lachnospiraceae bacterium]
MRLGVPASQEQSIPLRDSVFLTLRKAILTGKMKPGERLTEVRLGRMLGTSRTPIREAIRLLELEGLVTIIPGSGARVAAMTERDLQEVMEVRCVLEQLSVRLASRRITSHYRDELKAACDEFERTVQRGNEMEIAEADVRFHDVIMEASGNSLLCDIIGNLADNIYRYRYEYIRDEGHYGRLVAEHRQICDAILAGEDAKASNAAMDHIRRQYEYIRRQLDSEEKKLGR